MTWFGTNFLKNDRMLNRLFCFLVFVCLSIGNASARETHPINIVTTFSILADIIKQVGGENVKVHSLVDWDENAHVFRPQPADIRKLSQAELLVVNGLGFEPWLVRLLQSSNYQGETIVVSKGIEVILQTKGDVHHHVEGGGYRHQSDPHAWLSIPSVKIYVKNILSTLIEIDPDHRSYYEKNERLYQIKLDELHEYARAQFENIPKNKRYIVLPHNSYAYFAREYGLKVLGLLGNTGEEQSSAAKMAEVIKLIRKKQVPAIFSENVVNNRLISQLESETGAVFAGELISGALSKKLAPTYLKMMEHNINIIVQALAPRVDS